MLKTGYQNSQFAHQLERFACLYTRQGQPSAGGPKKIAPLSLFMAAIGGEPVITGACLPLPSPARAASPARLAAVPSACYHLHLCLFDVSDPTRGLPSAGGSFTRALTSPSPRAATSTTSSLFRPTRATAAGWTAYRTRTSCWGRCTCPLPTRTCWTETRSAPRAATTDCMQLWGRAGPGSSTSCEPREAWLSGATSLRCDRVS